MSRRIEDAMAEAVRYHSGQTRKGSGAPYVFHPLAVAGIVADVGGDEDTIIAAVLHDAVEDSGGPAVRAEIAERFGERVARIVDGCSDTDQTPKPPWRPRKEAFVERMRSASPEVRLVVTADKNHNVNALRRDLRKSGTEVWTRFTGGRDGTLWYYGAVCAALGDGWDHVLLDDLREAIAGLRADARHRR